MSIGHSIIWVFWMDLGLNCWILKDKWLYKMVSHHCNDEMSWLNSKLHLLGRQSRLWKSFMYIGVFLVEICVIVWGTSNHIYPQVDI